MQCCHYQYFHHPCCHHQYRHHKYCHHNFDHRSKQWLFMTNIVIFTNKPIFRLEQLRGASTVVTRYLFSNVFTIFVIIIKIGVFFFIVIRMILIIINIILLLVIIIVILLIIMIVIILLIIIITILIIIIIIIRCLQCTPQFPMPCAGLTG